MHLSQNFFPEVALSPFRHRLRIALTPAAAIEGDGGRGDIPFGEPELSSSSNDNYSPIETGDEPQFPVMQTPRYRLGQPLSAK